MIQQEYLELMRALAEQDMEAIFVAFRKLVGKIDASGPERAVESMKELFALSEGLNDEIAEGLLVDVGQEVSLEVQRALRVAWWSERIDN